MQNSQLARLFASGKTRGTGSNMFIDGDTIYSYGYHFPIARRMNGYYLFNSRGYSYSTYRHKQYVLSALHGEKVVKVRDCNMDYAQNQTTSNVEEIRFLQKKKDRCRSEYMRGHYAWAIKDLMKQNQLLNRYMFKKG